MHYYVNSETKEHTLTAPRGADWHVVRADDEGWVSWKGGSEAPLPYGGLCEVKLKSGKIGGWVTGKITKPASEWDWLIERDGGDIVAYRPACYHERGKLTPTQHDPLTMLREATGDVEAALSMIQEALPEGYEVVRTRTAAATAAPAEDMTDPANWREGDVVEVVGDHLYYRKGRAYFVGTDEEGDFGVMDDDGDVLECGDVRHMDFDRSLFRFHSRPTSSTKGAHS